MTVSNPEDGQVRDDATLVAQSLSGDRDAFSHIVARYQSLICAMAYSATGSLSQSEDLAQDTFLTAWKQLAGLRERAKLRPWLCGIARNLIHNFLRRKEHQPIDFAESLDEVAESSTQDPLPVEQAISREEQALLWRALEQIPDVYREPLVLFYREHKSAARVAEILDLNEEAVHQRLSWGRRLLQEHVLSFVEGALERIQPGRAFTKNVVAALPLLAPGQRVSFTISQDMGRLCKPNQSGEYEFEITHQQGNQHDMHLVEAWHLPLGAALLESSPAELELVTNRNGQVELRFDKIVPPMGTTPLAFRYRLVAAN